MAVAVLGAGITGLAAATELQAAGVEACVFEQEDEPGGLCRTRHVHGWTFDLSGGHVFNTKWDHVREWFFKWLPESEWEYHVRRAKVWYKPDLVVDYPFELALAQLPVDEAVECLADFFADKGEEPANLHDWLIWRFGRAMAEKYLIPYNRKIWDRDPKALSPVWVQGKMPLPSPREILRATLSRDASERAMPHSTFYYPRHGGIQRVVAAAGQALADLRLGHRVKRVERVPGGWAVNGEGAFDAVVWTLPLALLPSIMEAPAPVAEAAARLSHNSWTSTLFDLDLSQALGCDVSWAYVPTTATHCNKLSNYGSFSRCNAPAGHGSLMVDNVGRLAPELVQQDASALLPELSAAIASHQTEYAYVVFDRHYEASVSLLHSFCHDAGVTLLGRFGRWEYPNMDVCVRQAIDWVAGLTR